MEINSNKPQTIQAINIQFNFQREEFDGDSARDTCYNPYFCFYQYSHYSHFEHIIFLFPNQLL
jgi:hypothetical protein